MKRNREGVGGGYIELPPEKHPFELINTKDINIPFNNPNITVKVNMIELEVNAEYVFTKYNKINIVFKGIEND